MSVLHNPRGRFEDPVVKLIVRDPALRGPGNLFVTETRQVPAVGDEMGGFGNSPLYKVQARTWCPLGDEAERPWVVYLEVKRIPG